jgi:hypothetical protein
VAPGRVDILTELSGLAFTEAWIGRIRRPFGSLVVDVIGRDAFVKHKRATGRARDLAGIDGLE